MKKYFSVLLSIIIILLFTNSCDIIINLPLNNSVSGSIEINHNWSFSKVENSNNSEYYNNEFNDLNLYSSNKNDFVPNQLIVGFHEVTSFSKRENTLKSINANILSDNNILSAYLIEFHNEIDIYDKINKLSKDSSVKYVEPNYIFQANSIKTPNDPYYQYQWHYPLIRLPQAWSVTTGNSNIRVAVLDTGVDSSHEDLGLNVDSSSGYNFIDFNTNYMDYHGHGTHVAGTIGAISNNNIGVSGVMWNVSIVPVKVLNNMGTGSLWGIAQGIQYASGLMTTPSIPDPVHIINMSLGANFSSSLLENVIKEAKNAGVIMVAASGNGSRNSIQYPANLQEVIAVGASDFNYSDRPQKAYYSNFGENIDFLAPGGDKRVDTDGSGNNDNIYSTFNSNEYGFEEGTSMAAPHVAGVIGLMLSNGIPADEIRETLQRTAMDLGTAGFNNQTGYGLINAYWAVNNVKNIDILIGYWENDAFNYIKRESINLRDTDYFIRNIKEGKFHVVAHIDIQSNNSFSDGDYYAISEEIDFKRNKTYTIENLILNEINTDSIFFENNFNIKKSSLY